MNQQASDNSFYATIVYHPWKVIAATMVIVFSVGYFMQYVTPSISFKDLLGEDFPLLKNYEKVQAEYTNDDNLLVFIEAKDGDAFNQKILGGVKALTKALWKTPHSVRVDSVTNYQHSEANGDDLAVGDLVSSTENLTDQALARIKSIAINEPFTVNRVVNQQGNVLAVNVSFDFPNLEGDEKLNSDAFVQQWAEKFRQDFPETNVYVGGLTALDATVMKISMQETGMFLGLVMLVVVVLLSVILRTFTPILASVLVMIFSMMAGMAFSGMMGWKLTPFTSSVPMIILIIAVADCIHLITAFIHRFKSGEEKKVALINALRLNFKAIVITSVTTAVGFMTLNFSDSQSIGALGSQSAFGIMFACLLAVTFLPAMLALLPMKRGKERRFVAARFDKVTNYLDTHRVFILAGTLLLSLFMGYSVSKNEFNDSIPTYFAESLPWRIANDFSEEQFGGAYTFSYSLNAGQVGGVSDPVFLKKIEKFAEYLRTVPEVVYVNSIVDTFKRLNKNMHGDNPAYYRLPESKALAAQYLLLYEMSLPFGLDLNNQINFDKSGTKILAVFKTMSMVEVIAMENRINQWLDTNLSDVDYVSSGVQIMFAHLMSTDTRGLIVGVLYGLIFISLLLIFMFKSLKIGLLSLFPNLLPPLFAFGVWGLFVGQVGFGLAMVSGIAIGIIVDDTVHFLAKYLQARREKGLDAKQAVSYSFENVGPSIVYTTIVLVTGFIMMAFLSEFRVNSDMGKMTAIILCFALILDLVALPILLMIFDKDPSKEIKIENELSTQKVQT